MAKVYKYWSMWDLQLLTEDLSLLKNTDQHGLRLPVATRVAGRTGERKSETCSSFQAIHDSQIP